MCELEFRLCRIASKWQMYNSQMWEFEQDYKIDNLHTTYRKSVMVSEITATLYFKGHVSYGFLNTANLCSSQATSKSKFS